MIQKQMDYLTLSPTQASPQPYLRENRERTNPAQVVPDQGMQVNRMAIQRMAILHQTRRHPICQTTLRTPRRALRGTDQTTTLRQELITNRLILQVMPMLPTIIRTKAPVSDPSESKTQAGQEDQASEDESTNVSSEQNVATSESQPPRTPNPYKTTRIQIKKPTSPDESK